MGSDARRAGVADCNTAFLRRVTVCVFVRVRHSDDDSSLICIPRDYGSAASWRGEVYNLSIQCVDNRLVEQRRSVSVVRVGGLLGLLAY